MFPPEAPQTISRAFDSEVLRIVAPLVERCEREECIFADRTGSMVSAVNPRRSWLDVLGPDFRGSVPKSLRRTVTQELVDGGKRGMELARRLLSHTPMAMTVVAYAKPITPATDPTSVTGQVWRQPEGLRGWTEAEIDAYYAADRA